jgi:hypothetical protein
LTLCISRTKVTPSLLPPCFRESWKSSIVGAVPFCRAEMQLGPQRLKTFAAQKHCSFLR